MKYVPSKAPHFVKEYWKRVNVTFPPPKDININMMPFYLGKMDSLPGNRQTQPYTYLSLRRIPTLLGSHRYLSKRD